MVKKKKGDAGHDSASRGAGFHGGEVL